MKNRVILAALATTALTVGAGTATSPALAAPAHQTKTQHAEDALIKASSEGFAAMRQIHDARLAIFNANPDLAKKLVADAKMNLAEGAADWKSFRRKSKDKDKIDADYVVIDGAISLAEDFVATPEKQESVKKANEHLKKGDHKSGLETLRAADIDVNISQILMPLKDTRQHLTTASKMLKDGKYYQANLALKAAEDSLVFDVVDVYGPAPDNDTGGASTNG